MNPDKNRFERLSALNSALEHKLDEVTTKQSELGMLLRADGTPVPKHWSTFQVGENYVINNYTFKCQYIGETSILFEPVGPIEIKK